MDRTEKERKGIRKGCPVANFALGNQCDKRVCGNRMGKFEGKTNLLTGCRHLMDGEPELPTEIKTSSKGGFGVNEGMEVLFFSYCLERGKGVRWKSMQSKPGYPASRGRVDGKRKPTLHVGRWDARSMQHASSNKSGSKSDSEKNWQDLIWGRTRQNTKWTGNSLRQKKHHGIGVAQGDKGGTNWEKDLQSDFANGESYLLALMLLIIKKINNQKKKPGSVKELRG